MGIWGTRPLRLFLLGALSAFAFAGEPLSFETHLAKLERLEAKSDLARSLWNEQPRIARQIFSLQRIQALQVGKFLLLPVDSQGAVLIASIADYEAVIDRHRRGFNDDVQNYLRASAESNTYWNRMVGTWRSDRGHNGKTAPEIEADSARHRMLGRITALRRWGVRLEHLREYYQTLASADAADRKNVEACYNDLTRKMYTIPILAFAAPIALYVAAPGAILAGSGTMTGTGLATATVTVKGLGVTALAGGGLGLGTDALSQSAALLDGKQKRWSFQRSATSTAMGAVLLPTTVVAPPVGAVIITESTLSGSLDAYHHYEDGHRWSVAADITNTVAVPLAIYKTANFMRGPPTEPVNNVVPELRVVSVVEPTAVPKAPVEPAPAPVVDNTTIPSEPPFYIFQTNRPCSQVESEAWAAAKFEFRNSDFKTVTVEENGTNMLTAQDPNLPMVGISVTVSPTRSGLQGCYLQLPPGRKLPEGMAWLRDGKDVIPTSAMPEGHVTIANYLGMARPAAKKAWESWVKDILNSIDVVKGSIAKQGEAP